MEYRTLAADEGRFFSGPNGSGGRRSRRKTVKKVWLLGLILTLLIGVLGVGQVKTLYWNLGTEPPSLDPNTATDTTDERQLKLPSGDN